MVKAFPDPKMHPVVLMVRVPVPPSTVGLFMIMQPLVIDIVPWFAIVPCE